MLFLIAFILNLVLIPATHCDDPIVELPQGIVKGTHKMSFERNIFSAFEGIPYAKPPIGNLRFQEPQPLTTKWNGVLVANRSHICIQFTSLPYFRRITGTEDCLYMNVYVPRKQINSSVNFDVIVHVHGGVFMYGSPKLLAGPEFIMDRQVIYVTFSYRLGVLGFLSTEDHVVPGNNGLKDQTVALHWVKNNIEYFGGNPNSITLTGLSSGAACVQYHYLSTMSRGLFHRGFSLSGTVLIPAALSKNPLPKTKFVATKLGCPTNSSIKMVNCLRKKSVNDIIYATTKLFKLLLLSPPAPFSVVIEKSPNGFLMEDPYKILKNGDIYDVPWVTSNVSHEGQMYIGYFLAYKVLNLIDRKWNELAPYLLDLIDTVKDADKKEVVNAIRRHYNGNKPFTNQTINNMVEIFSDRLFKMGGEKSARLQASRTKSPVYYYYYRYVHDVVSMFPHFTKFPDHGDDAQLLFRVLATTPRLSENDEIMMRKLVDFLVTFAKTGVPKFGGVTWLPVIPNSTEIRYLDIASAYKAEMKTAETLTPHAKFWGFLPIYEHL